VVVELECGITVYPARSGDGRWRAVWHEDGQRQQCEAPSEEKLAAKLEKVKIRLEADAPNMRQPGAALIAHYLDPDRLPVGQRWSRKRICALPRAWPSAASTGAGQALGDRGRGFGTTAEPLGSSAAYSRFARMVRIPGIA